MDLKLVVVIAITVIIIVFTIVFGIVGYVAFKKTEKGTAKSFGLLFQRGNFLRIATVIFIVVAVVFLSLFDIIKENGIIAILSGVSGYVLGGLDKGVVQKEEENV